MNLNDAIITATLKDSTEKGDVFKFEYNRLSPNESTDLVTESLSDLLKEFRCRDMGLIGFTGNFTFRKRPEMNTVRVIDHFERGDMDIIGYKSDLIKVLDGYYQIGREFPSVSADLEFRKRLTELIKTIAPYKIFSRNIDGILTAEEINDELKRLDIPYRLTWDENSYIIDRIYKINKI